MRRSPQRKKGVWIWIIGIGIVIALWNQVVLVRYGLSLPAYVHWSAPLTWEEKAYVRHKGSILLGSDKTAPPISYYDEEKQQYDGLIVDYVHALSIELGCPIDIEMYPFYDLVEALKSGEIDTCDMFPSEGRSKLFDFTLPIYRLKTVLIVEQSRKDLRGPGDLAGKKVAIPKGDLAAEYITDYLKNAGKKSADFVYTGDTKSVLDLLREGVVDAAIGDEAVLSTYWKDYGLHQGGRFNVLTLYEKDVVLAVRKGEKTLQSLWNKGILQMKKKEIVSKVQQKWFGISESISGEKVPAEPIFQIILMALLLIGALYGWNYFLQRAVKEKTRELERTQENLRRILDNLNAALFIVDRENRIMDCNKKGEALLQEPREQAIGKNLFLFEGLPSSIGEWQEEKTYTKDGSMTLRDQLTYQGKVFEIHISSLLHGSIEQRIMGIEDITNKVVAEQRLRQESKMMAIGQLSAGLAHEIRNPLGLIRNYIYLLQMRAPKESNFLHPIRRMEESIDRINRLIEHLLRFSQTSPEAHREEDVLKILEGAKDIAGGKLKKHRIQCDTVLIGPTKTVVNLEAVKIILMNLLDNAVDALREKEGERWIRITVDTTGPGFQMEVSDNGAGITEEHLEQIFHPFFTTKETGEGTGLGLYVVYNEVQRFAGDVAVVSREGEGTTFHIRLGFGEEA